MPLVIYRTHSQTLALLREVDSAHGKTHYLLDVAHVYDTAKVKAWRKRGAQPALPTKYR
jgi:hypothetical protein